MNYLQYKNKYPKTISKYFEWIANGNDINLYIFLKYLDFSFDELFYDNEYHEFFTFDNSIYFNILKSQKNILSDKKIKICDEFGVLIETMDSVLSCVEILINEKAI